jgi:hypothetical protein
VPSEHRRGGRLSALEMRSMARTSGKLDVHTNRQIGAMLWLRLYKMPMDVFSESVLVMLIGLETKNTIPVVLRGYPRRRVHPELLVAHRLPCGAPGKRFWRRSNQEHYLGDLVWDCRRRCNFFPHHPSVLTGAPAQIPSYRKRSQVRCDAGSNFVCDEALREFE